jgi:DedD protein
MGLLSDIKPDQRSVVVDDNVTQVRSRARRRLIGAAVLLAIGVIGFPLLFETKPRPVAADVPAVQAAREAQPAASAPTKVVDRAAAPAVSAAAAARPAASAPPMITERAEDAGREIPIPPPADSARAAREKAERDRIAKEAADKENKEKAERERVARAKAEREKQAQQAREQQAKADEARRAKAEEERRAKATLESRGPTVATGKSPATDVGRFAVQVGAYASDSGVRDVRNKLERVGLKSYTQVVASGTRVRTGPYGSRQEAEQAADKARSIGFQPSVVALPPAAGGR